MSATGNTGKYNALAAKLATSALLEGCSLSEAIKKGAEALSAVPSYEKAVEQLKDFVEELKTHSYVYPVHPQTPEDFTALIGFYKSHKDLFPAWNTFCDEITMEDAEAYASGDKPFSKNDAPMFTIPVPGFSFMYDSGDGPKTTPEFTEDVYIKQLTDLGSFTVELVPPQYLFQIVYEIESVSDELWLWGLLENVCSELESKTSLELEQNTESITLVVTNI